jgi:hypothetical protein
MPKGARMPVILLSMLLAACDGGGGNGRDADADFIETPDTRETADTEAAGDPAGEDVPAEDLAHEEAQADVPQDVPPDEEPGDCIQNVPPGNDVLQGSGQFLAGMNENTFCEAGHVTFTVTDVPAGEIADLHTGTKEYALVFALANSANRNYIQAMLVRQEDNETSPLVVKVGGGTCIDCVCCDCVLDPDMGDGWCASEVYRGNCAIFDEAAPSQTYTVYWDSDTHQIWYRRGSFDLKYFAKLIPVPFAFNKYCAMGQGCDMMHWGPPSWSTGTMSSDVVFVCDRPITAAPPSCP